MPGRRSKIGVGASVFSDIRASAKGGCAAKHHVHVLTNGGLAHHINETRQGLRQAQTRGC
jgi:hypothetical protein